MKPNEPLTVLKGIGAKRAALFEEKGIRTVEDLIRTYPVRYQDRTKFGDLHSPEELPVVIHAKVLKKGTLRQIRAKLSLFVLQIQDMQTGLPGEVLFFNQYHLISHFSPGEEWLFYGKVSRKKGKLQLYSPQFARITDKERFCRIIPEYVKIAGVSNGVAAGCIERALEACPIEETLPQAVVDAYALYSESQMLHALHKPKNAQDLAQAVRRLKYNEGVRISLGIAESRQDRAFSAASLGNYEAVNVFIKNLPFRLTDAQEHVLEDVFADLDKELAMNRMIEGDVGSGKTIIAVICAYLMAINGYQTVYMAPTEILAEQHAKTFDGYLSPYGISTALLTGKLNAQQSTAVRKRLENGEIDVVIGTHALIQEATAFYNPGLVVTDEQHRFGVRQRAILSGKSAAHTLVMSATPIPRSLALTMYGDLDLSVIDAMPEGRKKVKTYFYTEKALPKILKFMEDQIKQGYQAFLICPFIEDSETLEEVRSVESVYKKVKQYAGTRFKTAALHSRHKPEDKERIIRDFNAHKTDLLVATSIIEVGIDVPNVTVIAILSADRFGLSQLHQLRGRTGRNSVQSYCFLVSNNKSEETLERMKIIVNCHDGARIAEEDYKLRGAGDYFGFRQHGFGTPGALDPLKDAQILSDCREIAQALHSSHAREDMICRDAMLAQFEKKQLEISMN